MRMHLRLAAVILGTALLAAACGGQSGEDQTIATPPADTGTRPATGGACDPTAADAPADGKPEVVIPDEAPPTSLQKEDITEGDGAVVESGDRIMVHYVGVGWNTKQQFDSSWDRGQPVAFPLSGVIEGWQEGMPGMKEGGRRKLVIPGPQAYGPNPPAGSGIEPDETLVFIVDVIEICAE